LRYFKNFADLGLSHCSQVQDFSLKGLEISTELRSIELENCVEITNAGIAALGGSHLHSLNVKNCKKLTFEGLTTVLARSSNIRVLNIGSTNLSDEDIPNLVLYCPFITRLTLSGLLNLTDDGLIRIIDSLHPNLTLLKIDYCAKITDKSLNAIWSKCKKLTELSAMFLDDVSDQGFDALDMSGESGTVQPEFLELETLYLGACLKLTDAVLFKIAYYCPKLKLLSVPCLKEISDIGLLRISKDCPKLQHLNVAYCSKISPAGVKYIVSHCVKLKQLDLGGVENMTDLSLNYIGTHCYYLKTLDISQALYYSEEAIIEMVQKCIYLCILKIRAKEERYRFAEKFFASLKEIRPYLVIEKNY
jgi:hypothetical protein